MAPIEASKDISMLRKIKFSFRVWWTITRRMLIAIPLFSNFAFALLLCPFLLILDTHSPFTMNALSGNFWYCLLSSFTSGLLASLGWGLIIGFIVTVSQLVLYKYGYRRYARHVNLMATLLPMLLLILLTWWIPGARYNAIVDVLTSIGVFILTKPNLIALSLFMLVTGLGSWYAYRGYVEDMDFLLYRFEG